MAETRIKISSIVENQLPEYVREEFPLISEFLKQYYISAENQGGCLDIIQNIDKYIKLEQLTSLVSATSLTDDLDFFENSIKVSSTSGFPDRYGLLRINGEIITYTGQPATEFTGCVRGFSGVTSLKSSSPDRLVFSTSLANFHNSGSTVENLSILFLKEFYKKVKTQFVPGFEDRTLFSELNESLFIKQSKDFYSSKGTDESFKILFKCLYGENVEVIKPRDYLIQASDASYRISKQIVVEAIEGDPQRLENRTLFQDQTPEFNKAYGSINKVEKIFRGGKEYYRLSLDYDYNRDINVTGSVFGEFSIHPKTTLITQANINDTSLDVDSTVGFPNQGTLLVTLDNGTQLTITYGSKTLNQFLQCSGITQTISQKTEIANDSFAYGYVGFNTDPSNLVKVRVTGVLSDLITSGDSFYFEDNENIEIETLGKKTSGIRENCWLVNSSPTYQVKNVARLNVSNFSYSIETFDQHNFILGDRFTLSAQNGIEYNSAVISIPNKNQIVAVIQSELDSTLKYKLRRNLSKVNFRNQPDINNLTSNVQNVYVDDFNSVYIASSSIPSYQEQIIKNDRSITFSASVNGEDLTFRDSNGNLINHHFYTGDAIVYTSTSDTNRLNIPNGNYFVKRVDEYTVKLSYSISNIYRKNYITLVGSVTNNLIQIADLSSKNIKPQKLLRKISVPIENDQKVETPVGKTGILVNGVEILNYKSKDSIYYGPIEEIIVTAPGTDYDIINPPALTVTDDTGSGANGLVEVEGNLKAINIVDGGFDYLEEPVITISGGNGYGARVKAELAPFDHISNFNSASQALLVNLSTNTIGFSSFHKFRDGERIIYRTYGQSAVGGLSTDASYYVSVQDAFNVKVHKTYEDAIVGINTIDLTSYGVGNHDFQSYERKKKIVDVRVLDPGINYKNRKIRISPVGINTYNNTVFAKNHRYSSGEVINYTPYGTPVTGLSSGSYYVTKVDEDNFKLSPIGSGVTASDFYFRNKIYSNLETTGIGTHEFNYPPITVSVTGVIGVSTLTGQNYNAILQPIFRGEIKSVFLESNGVGYGSSEILNHNKQPSITLNSGSGAQISPIISNGRIQEVLVQSSGSGYNSPPTISVSGAIGIATGYNLTPVIENGRLVDVKVINGGINFVAGQINSSVISSGSGAKFECRINRWNVNLFERLFEQFGEDDGVITPSINSEYELQYSHLYAPRKLRQTLFATKNVSGEIVYTPDLRLSNDKEFVSDAHSPIIGWAYDGNPIYGPYGYSQKSGGVVKLLKSGYALSDLNENRPNFPRGFFVEDYVFVGDGDLDEHNGRFCVTPEFPNGVYAYFATIDDGTVESSGPFRNYKKPTFPYLIGNRYKSIPEEANFLIESNQDVIDLRRTDLLRNTNPYGLNNNNSEYEFIIEPNSVQKQLARITNTNSSEIDYVKVIAGGDGYKVNDLILFDGDGTGGSGASARVSSVSGKKVKSVVADTLELFNVEFLSDSNKFIGFSTSPHQLLNRDIVSISGVSTFNSYLNSQFTVGVQSSILSLASSVPSQSNTGMVTYFSVYGNLSYPSIRENDIYQIDSERVKILSVDRQSSRIKVIRGFDSTVGSSHTQNTSLVELTRKFSIPVSDNSAKTVSKVNRELYFDPSESLGLGTALNGNYILNFTNPGSGATSLTIPTRAIYLPGHNLQTGDEILYKTNGGSPVSISTNGIVSSVLNDGTTLYATKFTDDLFGLSYTKVGLGSGGQYVSINSLDSSNIFYYTGVGTGSIHSLVTNYSNRIFGKVDRNKVTVTTDSNHGLSLQDFINFRCISGITTTYKVVYNDSSRRLTINPKSFTSGAVNTTKNTITIANHGYTKGQAVIYTATTPSVGLKNNQIYYVIVNDNNTIQLAENYYNTTLENPVVVDIASSSAGTIALVNPLINVVGNQRIVFDLSDSSLAYITNSNQYSAFDFNLYLDSSFKNAFDTTLSSSNFEVIKSGRIGIDSTANLTLNVSDIIPRVLYYNLSPIQNSDNPSVKKQIVSDKENVINSNQINIIQSKYSQNTTISGIGSTTFTFNIPEIPEKSSYTDSEATIDYDTVSNTAEGGVFNIELISRGRKYKKLPIVSSILSDNGKNAIIRTYGKNVGSINRIEIDDIGFDYHIDTTIRPTAKLPQILRVDPLFGFKSIKVSFPGNNYVTPPNLLVIDGLTNKVVPDVILRYNLGDPEVKIIKNSKDLTNTIPKIIPLNNSNGIRINNITYNNSTKDVTLQLITNYSEIEDFPFSIGDEIFIENVSVGINSTSRGFNSSAYNYQYFKVKSVNPNIGGSNAEVTYNLGEYLRPNEDPGTFQPILSSGVVVRKADQPIFNPILERNEYLIGEKVVTPSASGIVHSWDSKNQLLKILSSELFNYNEKVIGDSSDSRSTIIEIYRFNSTFDVSSSSVVRSGWSNDKGFLNNSVYRIHDSDYYQYLSYSLKSKISYEDWNNPVSSLNHTAGFKKFSDLLIESESTEFSGISTSQDRGVFTSIADLVSYVDLNSVYDFDLVSEKTLNISNAIISDEIVFNSRIIQDYFESIGNRVLLIDDISNQFSSNPRNIEFSVVDVFLANEYRVKKYLALAKDKDFIDEKQVSIVTILTDGLDGYINQYAKNDTRVDLGSFDYRIVGIEGNLQFFPNKLFINNYDVSLFSIDIQDGIIGVGTTSLGDIVKVSSTNSLISAGTTSSVSIVGIASTYRSSKVLVEIHTTNNLYCQYSELNVLHNGSEVELLEYGQLNNNPISVPGIGTYNAYISGSNINIDLIPNVSIATSCIVNTVTISVASTLSTGIGTYTLNSGYIDSNYVSIASSTSPVQTQISGYEYPNQGGYYLVSIEDKTNNEYQLNELVVTDDEIDGFLVSYGELTTNSGLGTFGVNVTQDDVKLMFTPIPNIDVDVRVYQNAIRLVTEFVETREDLNLNNFLYRSGYGFYKGTFIDLKRAFELRNKGNTIFEQKLNSENTDTIQISNNIIKIPNHFFVTGERLDYTYSIGNSPIGIATTSVPGIGLTDILPREVYAIKLDDSKIRLADSVENALKSIPVPLTLRSLGIGTNHYLRSRNANNRSLITLDNVVQSPIVSTSVTTATKRYTNFVTNAIEVTGITSFFGGDLIQIDNEIMKINAIGVAGTNILSVERPWMGTGVQTHSAGSIVRKISGDYNIVGNTINFYTSPIGQVPLGTTTNRPDEIDYLGITTNSTFTGRVFLRSSIPDTSIEPYSVNCVFDDISSGFNGITTQFTLKVNGADVAGISSSNPLIIINEIVQQPQRATSPIYINGDYRFEENVGITSIQFTGNPVTLDNDVKTSNIPVGGIIVSVASTNGFGYQPLVSAGGTAVVSAAGTIQSVSIGNSGSGYRSGIQTVNVGVTTSNLSTRIVEYIGIASIVNGNVVGVAITNPGFGYTSTNPPIVVFDAPLSYSNLPLIYSNTSTQGIGTGAKVNVIVGQGSSVIDFEITNYGFGYGVGERLTIPISGAIGIPTTSSANFNEFQITIDRTQVDKFFGLNVGDFELLDPIDDLFNGIRTVFPIRSNGIQKTIRARSGSLIDIKATLLVFINDILQSPNSSYIFNGGSTITFTEAPKSGDKSKIIFYKGTSEVDVVEVDVLETVKPGDRLKIESDTLGLDQEDRTVNQIVSSDAVKTLNYDGVGITLDEKLLRPVVWRRQTEDLFIDGKQVTKDRTLYDSNIQPYCRIIQSVGIGSTIIFVDNLRTFFESNRENASSIYNSKLKLVSSDNLVSAAATAVVSVGGTISQIVISNGGSNYEEVPEVIVQNPIGLGVTQRATATASITNGIVTSITLNYGGIGYTGTNPPNVLIAPPKAKIEFFNAALYSGDFGIISGISTTSVGIASTALVFDLFIPQDSFLRSASVVGSAVTISGIQTGYYFTVYNSNIGNGTVSLRDDGSTVSAGNTFLDNVYQVASVSIAQTSVSGIGLTYVARVITSVTNNNINGIGTNGFYGEFSWGRILAPVRIDPKEFNVYNNGLIGISTSPIIERVNPLRKIGYTTSLI